MNPIAKTGCVLVIFGSASVAAAISPNHIDRPTPPPCAADGTCYPNENTWGWYPCHWRQWPGEVLVPTAAGAQPTPAEGQGGALKPYETPTPEQEDAQAPPSTKKTETGAPTAPESAPITPPTEGGAPTRPSASPTPTPPSTTGRPQQGAPPSSSPYPAPSYPAPSYPTPLRPTPTSPTGARPTTSDNDPPPSLPWKFSASGRGTMADALPQTTLRERPTATRQPAGNDPPPALPSVFHSAAL
jgi:hypothetical protein